MSFVKYRVKEVATDFGKTPKEIADIISKYSEKPKSNTQVLTEAELNALFDDITRNNQIKSLEQVFAVKPAPKAEAPKAEAPKAPAAQQQSGRPQQGNQNRPQQGGNQNRPQQQGNFNRPQQNNQQRPQQQNIQPAQPVKQPEPERKRERRVVDTSAVQVNANRFADVDNLVSERVQDYQGGKQRIGGGKGKQQKQQQKQQQKGNFKGNKSKNEEQEKMRRLQMEVARKVI